jgi:hypothetical protein
VQPREWRWLVAAVAFVGSLALFTRCIAVNRARLLTRAFAKELPAHLLDRGPYRAVRHPFYCSYVIAYIAGFVATTTFVLLPVIFWMGRVTRARRARKKPSFQRARSVTSARDTRTGPERLPRGSSAVFTNEHLVDISPRSDPVWPSRFGYERDRKCGLAGGARSALWCLRDSKAAEEIARRCSAAYSSNRSSL